MHVPCITLNAEFITSFQQPWTDYSCPNTPIETRPLVYNFTVQNRSADTENHRTSTIECESSPHLIS